METFSNPQTEIHIPLMENTIKNLISQLDTCSDAEVPLIHSRIRRIQKELRKIKK
jgi:hypothetical protein